MSDATRLTDEQLSDLRTLARMSGNTFVNPAALSKVQQARFHPEWATAVLGRPYPGWNHVQNWELTLLSLALSAEPNRPTPAAVAERQEQGRREMAAQAEAIATAYKAELDAWHALKARLPVTVTVGHNWTIGHYDGHVAGKDHIVVQEKLDVGRLHRTPRQVLCQTASKTLSGARNKNPLRGVDRADDGDDRIPTCAACLHIAERIATPPAP